MFKNIKFPWTKKTEKPIAEVLKEINQKNNDVPLIVSNYLALVVEPFYYELKKRVEEEDITRLDLHWATMQYMYPADRVWRHGFIYPAHRPNTMFPIPPHGQLKAVRQALERRFLDDGFKVVYGGSPDDFYIFTLEW